MTKNRVHSWALGAIVPLLLLLPPAHAESPSVEDAPPVSNREASAGGVSLCHPLDGCLIKPPPKREEPEAVDLDGCDLRLCERWKQRRTQKLKEEIEARRRAVRRPTYTGSRVVPTEADIIRCESGGNPRAHNPTSTASGLYQFLDGTWNNYKGYPSAADAPVEVQREKFRLVFAGGAGASHWNASRHCWG